MTTIALVGAGPGLGTAVARRFGAEGFNLALISRSLEHVNGIAADLTAEGFTARGYAASVRDRGALSAALDRAAYDLGTIEILEYSPLPQKEFLRPVLDTTVEDLASAIEFSVLGPVTSLHTVLPGMRALGRGTILFVNGGSAVEPNSHYAGTSVAFAGESAYGRMLHKTLTVDGIHVGQLIIPGAITHGHPTHDPGVLAQTLWSMHTERNEFRIFAEPMSAA